MSRSLRNAQLFRFDDYCIIIRLLRLLCLTGCVSFPVFEYANGSGRSLIPIVFSIVCVDSSNMCLCVCAYVFMLLIVPEMLRIRIHACLYVEAPIVYKALAHTFDDKMMIDGGVVGGGVGGDDDDDDGAMLALAVVVIVVGASSMWSCEHFCSLPPVLRMCRRAAANCEDAAMLLMMMVRDVN